MAQYRESGVEPLLLPNKKNGGIVMKIVSWNLNGLIATQNNGSLQYLEDEMPEIICFQEIRTDKEPLVMEGYYHYWHHSNRDGYSGTAVLSWDEPLNVFNGFLNGHEDDEGRLITLEFDGFFLVNAYVPNSQQNFKRKAYRAEWDNAFREHIAELMDEKPVIICGDFNVARSELDIYEQNAIYESMITGFATDEQSDFETLLELGLCDVFRELYPEKRSYTWWSNRLNKRGENRGWRLDYFIVSEDLLESVNDLKHEEKVQGSDHCPILLEVDV